jgi:hypothetical protein
MAMAQSGMSNQDASQRVGTGSRSPGAAQADAAGRASGKHQGLRQPADDERVEDAVDNIGLSDRGESMEDQRRDRRGKGVRGGYDDSIDHDADSRFVEDDAVDPNPPGR